jgi:hypothetical protein
VDRRTRRKLFVEVQKLYDLKVTSQAGLTESSKHWKTVFYLVPVGSILGVALKTGNLLV